MEESVDKLNELLNETINIFKADRKLAKDNYEALRTQLDNILDKDLETSEECKLEQQVNTALKLVFESATRLEKVVESLTKIMVAQMNNESKERVASVVFGAGGGFGGDRKVIGRVDMQALLEDESGEKD